jgi:putative transcriptional regulator
MAKVLGSLAPGFLLAAPPLGDPNFDHTVVLLAAHSAEGALGFVVNRAAPLSLGELLSVAGYDGEIHDSTPVYLGGPVHPSSGWIVCLDPTLGADDDGVIALGEELRVTSSRASFDAMVRDLAAREPGQRDPQRRMVVLGYSGWGPGQLEGEIAAGAWLPAPLDEGVLFDVALSQKWERAYALVGVTPAASLFMHGGGEA